MSTSPVIKRLKNSLPLISWPWLAASLIQDPMVRMAAADLLNINLTTSSDSSPININPLEWSPAAIGLRNITPGLTPAWLSSFPMSEVNEEIQEEAFHTSANTIFPTQDWSLEKATWIAIAIRSDFLVKGNWDSVLDKWFHDPYTQHGTVLACLYGMVSNPHDIFRTLLKQDPSAINIALTLHALLSNPFEPDSQLQQLQAIICDKECVSYLPYSARLVLLHILYNQRPPLAFQLAQSWYIEESKYALNNKWHHQDPITWFYDLEKELLQAKIRQIMTLESDAVKILQRWKNTLSSLPTDEEAFSTFSDLVEQARNNQSNEPQLALHAVQKATQYLIGFSGKIPHYLLADSRLVPLIQELSELFFSMNRPGLSVQVLQEASKLQPTNSSLYILQARSQQKTNRTSEPISSLASALLLSPSRLDISTSLAESLEQASVWHLALPLRQALYEESILDQKKDVTQELYALANCSIQAQQAAIAINAVEELLSINPMDGIAYYYYGQAYNLLGELDQAFTYLTRATELSFDQPLPWLGLAEYHHNRGDDEQAIATLQAAAREIPENCEINSQLGQLHLAHRSFTQAEAALAIANRIAPYDPQIAYPYAVTLRYLGHLELANDILSKVLVAYPEDTKISLLLAEILIDLKQHEKALPYLDEIISSEPINNIEPYVLYAQVVLLLNENHPGADYDPGTAVKALEKALQIDSSNLHIQALLAEALSASNNYEQAMEIYQVLLDTELINDPEWSSRLSIGMARTAIALNKYDIAIATLQDVISTDPNISLLYRLLAEAYMAAQLPENALQAAQSALSLIENDLTTAVWIVTFLEQLLAKNTTGTQKPLSLSSLNQMLEDSIETIRKIIQNKPEHISLAISLGELHHLHGDPIAARKAYLLIANSDYSTSIDLINAANHLFNLEDVKGGISCLQRAVEFEAATRGTPSIETLQQLAQAYIDAGSPQMALKIYDRAIQVQPDNANIYIAKAKLLIESQQPQEAQTCLQAAIEQVPTTISNPGIHYMLALAYLSEGNLPASFDHSRRAIAVNKDYLFNKSDPFHTIDASHDYTTALYTLAAELARELLQPDLALKYLKEFETYLNSTSLEQEEYLAYFCLYNELNLEAEGKIVQDIEFPSPTIYTTNNPRLLALNARLAYWKGDPDQAKEFLKAAKETIELSGTLPTSLSTSIAKLLNTLPTYLAIAEAAIELRDWETSLLYLHKLTNYVPNNPLALLSLARFHILQAEYQELCQSCQVIRHSPGPEATSESALRSLRSTLTNLSKVMIGWQAQWDQIGIQSHHIILERWQARADMVFEKSYQAALAIQKLKTLIDDQKEFPFLNTPDDLSAIIAATRRIAGQIDEANNLPMLVQIAQNKTSHPIVLLQIAISLAHHHLAEAMSASLSSTNHLGQEHSSISALCYSYQAFLYQLQSMLPDALEKIQIALETWPDEPRWNAFAADIMSQLGNYLGAIQYLEEATKYEPGNVKHYLDLGRTYLIAIHSDSQADTAIFQKRAIRNLERATRLNPQDPQVWLALAQANFQIGDMSQADQGIKHVLEIQPHNYDALCMKAEIALILNQLDIARDYANKAVILQPDNPSAHILLARALELLDHPDEALQALERALPNSENPLPLQLEHAGLVKQLQGSKAALEELLAIAQQFPDDPQVLADLALAYADGDQIDAAIHTAQKSFQLGNLNLPVSKQARLHMMLGCLLRKTGHLDQSILHLHKAAQLMPGEIEPYLELGITHKERREFQQALQLFQKAAELSQRDPRPFYMAGLALKEGKDYRQSEVMLRRAASLAPQDVNIRRQLAAVVALNLVHNPTLVRSSLE